MENTSEMSGYSWVERIIPTFVKIITKKIYWKIVRRYNRYKYLRREKFVELGYRFRFTCEHPYGAHLGERTIIEDFNVWNARLGDINVGKRCWFGLNNIVMGPVDIGNDVSTGPYVFILGPRHPLLESESSPRKKTIIGNDVW